MRSDRRGAELGVALLVRGTLRRCRTALAVTVLVGTLTLLVGLLALVVDDSANPRPGEVSARLLGPYQLRVSLEAGDTAPDLLPGVTAVTVTESTERITGPGGAYRYPVHAGAPEPGLWRAGASLLEGDWPQAAGQVALSRATAEETGWTPGTTIRIGDRAQTVSGVFRPAAEHTERLVLAHDAGSASDPDTGTAAPDDPGTVRQMYLLGPEDGLFTLADQFSQEGLPFVDALYQQDRAVQTVPLGGLGVGLVLAAWICLFVVFTVGNRRLTADLRRARIAGVGLPAARRTLLVISGGIGLGVLVLTVAVTVLVVVSGQGLIEDRMQADWYGRRLDVGHLVLVVVLTVLAFPAVVAARAGASSRLTAGGVLDRAGTAPARAGAARVPLVLGCVALTLAAFLFEVSAFGLLLALPLGVLVGTAVSSVLSRLAARPAGVGSVSLLRGVLRRRGVLVSACAALVVTGAVVPLTYSWALISMSVIDRRSQSTGELLGEVPFEGAAVYVGSHKLPQTQWRRTATASGATADPWWNLTTAGDLDRDGTQAQLPVVPELVSRCNLQVAPVPSSSTCALALRGVGEVSESFLTSVLGRDLSPDERDTFRRGGPIAISRDLAEGELTVDVAAALINPPAPGSSPSPTARRLGPVRYAPPAEGHRPGRSLPALYVLRGGADGAASPDGVLLSWPDGRPTPQQLRTVRQSLTSVVEQNDDVYLVTDDDDRLGWFPVVVSHIGWVLQPVIVAVALLIVWLLRQQLGADSTRMAHLGASRRMLRRWFAATAFLCASIGTAGVALGGLVGTQFFLTLEHFPLSVVRPGLLLPLMTGPFIAWALGYLVGPPGDTLPVAE